MEGKAKVVWVVDKACENGRVRREVERLYDWTKWIEARLLTVVYYNYIVLCGVITLVFIYKYYYLVYEHNVHLNYEL